MSLRFLDSFDHYDTAHVLEKWTGGGGNIMGSGTAIVPRTGSGCLAAAGDGIYRTIDFQPTWIVGGAFWFPSLNNEGGLAILAVGATCVSWRMEPDGLIQIIPGVGGGTTTGTSSLVIHAGGWNFIEFMTTLGTAGTAILKINGQTACTLASVNITTNTSGDVINIVGLGGGSNLYVDDFYVFDTNGATNTTFAGDCRIGTLTASADTTTIAWQTSTGTVHYSLINEIPPDDDSTYVQSTMTGSATFSGGGTAGPSDIYKYQTTTAAVVVGVQSNIFARKTDVANRAVSLIAANAGTAVTITPTGQYLNLNYLDYLNQFDVNPIGSGSWTPSVLNTTSWGVQVVV